MNQRPIVVTAAAVLVCWSIGASAVQAQRFGLASIHCSTNARS